jgi:GntR family transcriptional regulator, rspAB operon transcriptional repressor
MLDFSESTCQPASVANLERLPEINRRLADAVYDALRELILARDVQPGDRLDMDLLAAKMKVSRTPVKDALARLASEGLVQVIPRGGTFVRRLTARDLAETFDVRGALEGLAAERVAVSAGPSELEALEKLLHSLEHDALDPEEHWKRNALFHRRLVELAGNLRLVAIYDLQAHLQIARVHRRSADWRGRARQEALEHRAILQALQNRDPVAARVAVMSHIDRAKKSLLSDFEQLDGDVGSATSACASDMKQPNRLLTEGLS